jgi:polyisoprenoid-binding protein YceI
VSDITGTWTSDPIHSSLDFTARHNIVSVFRGQVGDFSATLSANGAGPELTGAATVESIVTKDDNLTAHLRSPEFFDLERHPELRIRSTSFVRSGAEVTVDVDLEMRGVTQPVRLTGTIAGPVEDPFGGHRVGLDLQGTVDRTDFGMNWNASMPGGGLMLSKDVKLVAHLELVKG